MNEFTKNNIQVLAYADDIVCWCENMNKVQESIEIMKNWCSLNRMKINATKSGIMRILLRKGKCSGITNNLNIPEVNSYNYLGITLTQTLKLKEHEVKIRSIESHLMKKLNIFSHTIKSTKAKKIFFKMMKSKCSYGIEALIKHDPKYEKKWNSTLYRLLKKLFSIKWNISKTKLFDTLNLNNEKLKIQRN